MWIDLAPYLGRDYASLDCYGLVIEVYRNEFNIKLPGLHANRELMADWISIREGMEQPGDVILFKGVKEADRHVAIVLDAVGGLMLHTQPQANCCVERYRSPVWINRIQKFLRHRERSR